MDPSPNEIREGDRIPPSNSTLVETSIHGVTSDTGTNNLSVEERLSNLSKYRIDPTEIGSAAEPSGKGGKGDVIRASCRRNNGASATDVAVKMLRFDDSKDEKSFPKEFVHEVELLAKLSHKNIVQLIGFVEDFKHQKAWIVLSWEPNGNVREFLASGKWEIPERISLIKDMFGGLRYLHTRQPPIRHGDLKSLNILVSSSYHAVITDFGSARVLKKEVRPEAGQENVEHAGRDVDSDESDRYPEVTIVTSANQLTLTGPDWSLRWAAPEVVKEETRPILASDIWSAGWVCWEMMTNKVPFDGVKRDGAIMLKVIRGQVPSIHEDTQLAQVIALCSLMEDCWKYKPETRPDIGQCYNEVQWMPSVPPFGGTSPDTKEMSPDLLLEMGRMHYLQNRSEIAASLFERAVRSGEAAVDEKVVAEAVRGLADSRRSQSKYAEAEELYAKAQEIYAHIGDDRGRAHTLRGLGDIYNTLGNDAEAEELYTLAQDIYARIGDYQGQAHTIRGLGDMYYTQRREVEAEELYTVAQEIYAGIGDDHGRAHTSLGLGDVCRAQREYIRAEEWYMRAQEIYARIGNDQGRANTILGLGHLHSGQGNYAEAKELYTLAQDIYVRSGDDLGRANTLRGLGDLHRAQDHRMEAAECYAKARDLYSQIGNSYDEDDASYWLATVLDEDDDSDSDHVL